MTRRVLTAVLVGYVVAGVLIVSLPAVTNTTFGWVVGCLTASAAGDMASLIVLACWGWVVEHPESRPTGGDLDDVWVACEGILRDHEQKEVVR